MRGDEAKSGARTRKKQILRRTPPPPAVGVPPTLTFKHLRSHPRRAAFVVGHVGLNVTRRSKVTDLQHSASSHQEQTAGRNQQSQDDGEHVLTDETFSNVHLQNCGENRGKTLV